MERMKAAARDILLSERTAWAAQNAVGSLFAALFTVTMDMQFALGCLCGVLYSASSLVLSLDRSVGGRLFGGVVFIGTVLAGGSLGGGLVSLAWVARGDGRALVDYLPDSLTETLPSAPTIQHLKDLFARLTSVPLPPELQKLVDSLVDKLSAELGDLLPPVAAGFWVLLMVLSILFLLPFGAARAQREFGMGVIIAIAVVFLSSMLVFGTVVPTLGMHLYWTEVVFGYFKVALATAAANVLAGTLVYVRSAHDDVRRSCASLLKGIGVRISRLGSAAYSAPLIASSAQARGGGSSAKLGQADSEQSREAATEQYLQSVRAFVDTRVNELCSQAAGAGEAELNGSGGKLAGVAGANGSTVAGLLPMPAGASDADLEVEWARLEVSLKTGKLEPPLPGLCSQPGADMQKYEALVRELSRLQRGVVVLGRGQAACLAALGEGSHPQLPSVLAQALALAATACAGAAEALAHMPPWGPCSGSGLSWRPLPASVWEDAQSAVAGEAAKLAASYGAQFESRGLDFALSLGVEEHRALLYTLVLVSEVLECAKATEAAAAASLEVPLPTRQCNSAGSLGGHPKGGTVAAAEATAAGDAAAAADAAEAGELPLESAEGAAAGEQEGGKPVAGKEMVKGSTKPRPSALKRLAGNPYVANSAILLILASPLPVVKLVLEACWAVVAATPGLLRSRAARWKAVKNPMVQYALKYWLAMAGTVVIIVVIMWKAIPDGPGPLQDAQQQIDFFIVWQPIYASITVSICLQDTVEASLFRGILRSSMTVLGGSFGYIVMLNGYLANNPYWVISWVCFVSAVFGTLATDRTLRYALFLGVFTFNAVTLCQYIGCCNVPGDPKVYAGKVVSTLIGSTVAILFGWALLPWYGSRRMLDSQASALRAVLDLIHRMHAEVAAAAAAGRPVSTEGWLESVEGGVQAPLKQVSADLELNELDRRQMPLTSHLLPEPVVVHLMQHAESALRDRVTTAVLMLRSGDLFATGSHGPSAPAFTPGPASATVLLKLQPDVDRAFAALDTLVDACAENMRASAAGSGLKPLRSAVESALKATEDARMQLHRRYLEVQPEVLAAAGAQCNRDFQFVAWLHAVLACIDEMLVAASMLLQRPAQDRDVFWGWVSAWRGRRSAPS